MAAKRVDRGEGRKMERREKAEQRKGRCRQRAKEGEGIGSTGWREE